MTDYTPETSLKVRYFDNYIYAKDGYLEYKSRLSNESYQLTQTSFGSRVYWNHTDPSLISKLWPDVEYLINKLMTIDVDLSKSETVAEYKDVWLEAFWLSSNLMPYMRGSSLYIQTSLSEIGERRNLPTPIYRKEHPQLNTLALTLQLEDFKAMADQFLEPWLVLFPGSPCHSS